jgi:hypothetical protein
MKTLHLTLKRKWFDMIASGEKTEEYRELKYYWAARLVDQIELNPREDESWELDGIKYGMETAKHFDQVTFKNGYSKNAPTISFKVKDIVIWAGRYEWGAEPGVKYFVIKLGAEQKQQK